MSNVKGIKDVKDDDEEDKKRQAYYAGGQGQNGGGSGQEVLDPREFMKRARDEMGAQTEAQWRDGQLLLPGGKVCRGYASYGKVLSAHDAKLQQQHIHLALPSLQLKSLLKN